MQSRASIIPKSLVNFQISKVEVEIDISMVDRIAAILNPSPLYSKPSDPSKGPMYSSFLSGPTMVSRRIRSLVI